PFRPLVHLAAVLNEHSQFAILIGRDYRYACRRPALLVHCVRSPTHPRFGRDSVDRMLTVGIIPTPKSSDPIDETKTRGWRLRSVKGSHHVFEHPTTPGHLTVPHPKKDLGKGLVHKIRKQAGLK